MLISSNTDNLLDSIESLFAQQNGIQSMDIIEKQKKGIIMNHRTNLIAVFAKDDPLSVTIKEYSQDELSVRKATDMWTGNIYSELCLADDASDNPREQKYNVSHVWFDDQTQELFDSGERPENMTCIDSQGYCDSVYSISAPQQWWQKERQISWEI